MNGPKPSCIKDTCHLWWIYFRLKLIEFFEWEKRITLWGDSMGIRINVDLFVNILVWASTIIVVLDLYFPKTLQDVALTIVCIFMVEVILKSCAFGIQGYLQDDFNKIDFVVSIMAFTFDVIVRDSLSILVVFRLVRMLRFGETQNAIFSKPIEFK